jgi:triacylglycerol lipase
VVTSLRRYLREVRAVLRVVRAVPVALVLAALRRPHDAERETPVATARSLVVLVHGFGAGPDCWDAVVPALSGAGVAVVTHRYAWTAGVDELGADLADEVASLVRRSGARSVTLVGHSLGGVVVAAGLLDRRLAGTVTRVVTVGAPLRGTGWARLFPVGAVRDLRPDSPVLRALAAAPVTVPWTTVASRTDVVVGPGSAALAGTERIVVDGVGHCGLLRDADVIARIAHIAGIGSRRERGLRARRSSEQRVRSGPAGRHPRQAMARSVGSIGRGRMSRPVRWASTPAAAERPSAMAQTISDWPRPASPAAKTPGTEVW